MSEEQTSAPCVLLAERHHALIEGMRSLLQAAFQKVFIVGDAESLVEGAGKLLPDVIIAELSLAAGDLPGLVGRIRVRAPTAKILLLSIHEHPVIARSVSEAGADGVVAKRSIATDLLPAVEAVLMGRHYLARATVPQP
jgi:DNA-binding NarL/FixJ family response regulator